MRDKRTESRYEFKLNIKEIALFVIGSIGVISLFFIIGIWIGKSLNEDPGERLNIDYVTESDMPEDDSAGEEDVAKKDDTSYDFQDSLNGKGIIPLNDDSKIKVVKTRSSEAEKSKKVKEAIDNFSVKKSSAADKSKKKSAAVKPKKPEKPKKKAAVAKKKGKYTVQIASLKSDKAALKLKSKLQKKGYDDAYFVATNIKGKGVWYRVRVGNYSTMEKAKKAVKSLEKSVRMKGMVVKDIRY